MNVVIILMYNMLHNIVCLDILLFDTVFQLLLSSCFFLMQSVVELIKAHFGQKVSVTGCSPPIPDFPVPSHKEPRFSCFVESEAAGVSSTFLLVLSMDVSACR